MFVRRLHTMPRLHLMAEGVPGLYSATGLRVAWTDFQQHILGKLNHAIADTDNASRVPFHIMQATRSKPELSHVFNYASLAHNNHLFFSTLKASAGPNETEASVMPGLLGRRIAEQFGDLDGLKRAFHKAAENVIGSGFVFLVETPSKRLEVVASQGAGSPTTYSRAQPTDLNGHISEDTKAQLAELQRRVSARETNWNIDLLALNLWEHAYVPDFGVKRRADYIDAWWSAIDWNLVDGRLFKGRV